MARRVTINQRHCTGCMICQLLCSYIYTKAYNPLKARIGVKPLYGESAFEVSLKPECNACGLCTLYCAYGALTLREEG